MDQDQSITDGSEDLVPRPGLVVTDFLMIALPVSSCLIISRDLRLPHGDGIYRACFNAFSALNP